MTCPLAKRSLSVSGNSSSVAEPSKESKETSGRYTRVIRTST